MKFLLLILLLTGCDAFYGLRVPIKPAYEGNWICVHNNIESIGLKAVEVQRSNQLTISNIKTEKYLFSVIPNYGDEMELYAIQVHAFPLCEKAEESIVKMKEFLSLMEQHCNYVMESYEAEMQCRSK